MSVRKILAGAMCCLALAPTLSHAAESKCRMNFFKDTTYALPEKDENEFSAYDKVHLQIDCQDLPAMDYTVTAVWHNPSHQVQRQDSHTFQLASTTGYRISFWMKILEKGPLQSALSNRDFFDSSYGRWSVLVYVNSQVIGTGQFTVTP